jgi:hypothetical protein
MINTAYTIWRIALPVALGISLGANIAARYQRIADKKTINQSVQLLFEAKDIMGGLVRVVKACKDEKENAP